MLAAIERATGAKIEQMALPSTEMINDKRIAGFKQSISDTLAAGDLAFYSQLVEQYQAEHNVPAIEIAAALAQIAQGDSPLLLKNKPAPRRETPFAGDEPGQPRGKGRRDKAGRRDDPFDSRAEKRGARQKNLPPPEGMERFRIEVGHNDQVMPGNIVGAIANEAGLDSKDIGRINIFDRYSTVDLPLDMPDDIFKDLKNTWVAKN